MEAGINATKINVRTFTQFVIDAAREPPTAPLILIFADVLSIEIASRGTVRESRHVGDRLGIIDAPAIPVIRAANERSPALVGAKSLSDRSARLHDVAVAHDGRGTAAAKNVNRWAFTGSFGNDVDGPADAVTIHIGLQCFVYFDGFHQICRHRIEFDFTDTGLRGRNVDSVDRGVGEARLKTARLDVFPLAFIAFQANPG